MKKNNNKYTYYDYIISFGSNITWYQKLFIKILLFFPKGRKESKDFDALVRYYRY